MNFVDEYFQENPNERPRTEQIPVVSYGYANDLKARNRSIRAISSSGSWTLLWLIIVSNIISFAVSFIMGFMAGMNGETDIDQNLAISIINILVVVIGYPIAFYKFGKSRGRGFTEPLGSLFSKPQKSAVWVIKWVCISLSLTYLVAYGADFIVTLINSGLAELGSSLSINTTNIDFGDTGFGYFTYLFLVAISAPIMEELLFRGILYKNSESLGELFAVALSGITFGLYHANGVQSLYTIVLGVTSCLLLLKTESIIPSMILHFMLNGVSTFYKLTGPYSDFDFDRFKTHDTIYIKEHFGALLLNVLPALFVLAVIIIGLILFIVEVVRHIKNRSLHFDNGCYDISPAKKFLLYFSSPVTIITYLLIIITLVINTFLS